MEIEKLLEHEESLDIEDMKICTKCKSEKPLSDFYRSGKNRCAGCKVCDDKRKKANAEKLKSRDINKIEFPQTKQCCKCKEIKKSNEFNIRLASKDALSNECKSCVSIIDLAKRKDLSKYRQEQRDSKCGYCGIDDVEVLESNHLNIKDKLANISELMVKRKIDEEIKKTNTLCANCHGLHTNEQRKAKKFKYPQPTIFTAKREASRKSEKNSRTRNKEYIQSIKFKIGECQICKLKVKEENTCIFSFDHIDVNLKKRTIAGLATSNCSIARIDEELKLCRLICLSKIIIAF